MRGLLTPLLVPAQSCARSRTSIFHVAARQRSRSSCCQLEGRGRHCTTAWTTGPKTGESRVTKLLNSGKRPIERLARSQLRRSSTRLLRRLNRPHKKAQCGQVHGELRLKGGWCQQGKQSSMSSRARTTFARRVRAWSLESTRRCVPWAHVSCGETLCNQVTFVNQPTGNRRMLATLADHLAAFSCSSCDQRGSGESFTVPPVRRMLVARDRREGTLQRVMTESESERLAAIDF